MARRDRQNYDRTHELPPPAALEAWFSNSGNDTETIDEWDIRPDDLAAVILGCMADGIAVFFTPFQESGTIQVTLKLGEVREKAYLADSVIWIEWFGKQAKRAAARLEGRRRERAKRVIRTLPAPTADTGD